MTGIVLCGGESKRMGSDKGLLKRQEQTWAGLAETKLSALQIPTFVSINKQQRDAYSQSFPAEKLIFDNDDLNVKVPMLAILSCHLQLPGEDLFVLACDMTDITVTFLQKLFTGSMSKQNEAYVYSTGARLQPLCGIYTSPGLKKIYRLYEKGELRKFSMMHVLDQLDTDVAEVDANFVAAFRNYNSPAESGNIS